MSISDNASLSRSVSTVQAGVDGLAASARFDTVGEVSAADSARIVDIGRLAAIVLQLALLALVIHQFEIESAAFLHLALFTFGGFVVHSVLPLRYRLPFFALLSLAGIALVLGLRSGAVLVTIGLVLIGICHLPAPFRVRVALVALAGASLGVLRVEWIRSPWSMAIWPILGSMFMFRLCVYLYDLKHDKEPPSVARTLSYFFLLPNVCFPLFPVIDYKTFRRTYYNEEAFEIYQNGIRWMLRGIVQLVLYRLVYLHMTITPAEVADVPDLVRYLTSNFLLYLRVSGSFHLIVGMLHLFGFNLPPTHYLFYLASSFNDFWRRINIYWKDFMMKLFYYPAYFSLRRLGATSALVISTFFVFGSTWLLHSYQWFWLRGSFPLNWQDGVFWGLLAVLVVANSLHEAKHGRARSLGKRSWTFNSLAGVSLRTFGTFCVICVLWSVWTSESLSEWLSLWSVRGGWGMADATAVGPAVLLGMLWLGSGGGRTSPAPAKTAGRGPKGQRFWRSAMVTALSISGLYAVGHPAVYSRLGDRGELIASVRSPGLNARDASQLEAGYYEGLLRVDRFNTQLWEVYMRNPLDVNDWGESGRTVRWTNDFKMKELRANLRTQLRDRPFSTNQWGMRDQDYQQAPPPGTLRIALMGSSVVMGSGVADGENFESLLESRLNSQHTPRPYAHYEILNFSVGGYGPLEQVGSLDQRVLSFQPNVLLYVAHWSETQRAIKHLVRAVTGGVELPYPELRDIVRKSGIDSTTAATIAEARLQPFGAELIAFAYRHIAAQCRSRGITAVWIFLPVLRDSEINRESAGYARAAADAGFFRIDLADMFAGLDWSRLRVSDADYHPNRDGHQLIAERLYTSLMELDVQASFGLFGSQKTTAHQH
jgi:hypothetical protein